MVVPWLFVPASLFRTSSLCSSILLASMVLAASSQRGLVVRVASSVIRRANVSWSVTHHLPRTLHHVMSSPVQ